MEDTTLRITRTFNAPLARVWQAWTNPEDIKKWWGPATFSAPHAEVDFREGGTYLYCMRGAMGPGMPEQDFWSTGTYKEIIPMEKIVASDHFADAEGNIIRPESVGMPGTWADEMIVTVEFKDLGDDTTELTITHTGHPIEMKENAAIGWNQSLDKFAAAL